MKYRFRKHPSKLATLMVTFGAGSRAEQDTDYPDGIAHYMEHVRFKGTDTKTAKDLLRQTADAGGSWNAWTSNNLVSYYMTIPEENIETAFQCLADVVLNPAFPQEELTKEQEVICQEVRMYEDDIDNLVHYKLMGMAFDNSLAVPIVGTEESVRSINREHLLNFNKEFYSKEHMFITLGAVSDHKHLVEKYFGVPDDTLLYRSQEKNVKYKTGGSDKVFKEGQLQDSISVCFGNPELRELARTNRADLKVFSAIFGQGDTSRLWMKVREDLGMVYGIGAYLNNNMDGTLYEIYTSTEPENTERVIKAIHEEIDTMLAKEPSEAELVRAKNMIRSATYRALDTSSGTINRMLSEEFFGHKTGSEFLADVDAVTAKDVHDIAFKIFEGTKYMVVGTGS